MVGDRYAQIAQRPAKFVPPMAVDAAHRAALRNRQDGNGVLDRFYRDDFGCDGLWQSANFFVKPGQKFNFRILLLLGKKCA